MYIRLLIGLMLLFLSHIVKAQTGGLSGTVKEKKNGYEVIGAIIEVRQNDEVVGTAITDVDGKYFVKPLQPSDSYEVRVRFSADFKEIWMRKVLITPDRTTYQNFQLEEASHDRK